MKNCGDHVHFLVVERGILPEMVKVAKKKVSFLVHAVVQFVVQKSHWIFMF